MATVPQGLIMKGARPPKSSARRHPTGTLKERLIHVACFMAAFVAVATTAGIIWILAKETLLFFQDPRVTLREFLTGTKWSPTFADKHFGILPLVVGTLYITFGAALVAVPLGLLTGVYLSEYAHPRVRMILKPILEILAGIPTVVYGYFALFFVTPLLQRLSDKVQVFNAAAGCIVVGIMILPLVSSLCEDALSAVPRSLREGAYALGATKFEVTKQVVMPAALSGIMAGIILAISRAVGETMAVTLAAGAMPNLTPKPGESLQTMTAYIVQVIQGEASTGSIEYRTLFAVAMALFLMTMSLNLFATRLVKRYRTVYS